jgi:hypothetical protein
MQFNKGQDYNNVYFMQVDAQGHSSIVRRNTADLVDRAFDSFETMVYEAVDEAQKETRCEIVGFWGWAGDGGLCIVYDAEGESKARETVLKAARIILQELPALNTRLARIHVQGDIHARIAIHKGSFRYKGDDRRGSIHSKDLNFCVHLEKVLPQDTIGISEDVFNIVGEEGSQFIKAAIPFENKTVYLSREKNSEGLQAEWRGKVSSPSIASIPLESDLQPLSDIGLMGFHSQRALTLFRDKINNAQQRIWVMATGLGGFQTDHKQSLSAIAARDVDIRILALDPDTQQCSVHIGENDVSLPGWRDWETSTNYNREHVRSLQTMISRVNKSIENKGVQNLIKFRYYRTIPYCAILVVDSTVYYSPYLINRHNLKLPTIELVEGKWWADLCIEHFITIWESDELSRDA